MPPKKKKKKKGKRCAYTECGKKLSDVDRAMACKCKNAYCALHRSRANHNCAFNDQKNKILLPVQPVKVETI